MDKELPPGFDSSWYSPIDAMLQLALTSQASGTQRPPEVRSEDSGEDKLSCSLTCNNKPAWMDGLLPCWGVLNISCQSSSAKSSRHQPVGSAGVPTAATKPATKSSLRRTLVMPNTHPESRYFNLDAAAQQRADQLSSDPQAAFESVHHPEGSAAAHHPEASVAGRSMSFGAACKGLWTGILGKMCMGLTLGHGSATWTGGHAEVSHLCAGRLLVQGHKGASEASMGSWCHGTHASIETMIKERSGNGRRGNS